MHLFFFLKDIPPEALYPLDWVRRDSLCVCWTDVLLASPSSQGSEPRPCGQRLPRHSVPPSSGWSDRDSWQRIQGKELFETLHVEWNIHSMLASRWQDGYLHDSVSAICVSRNCASLVSSPSKSCSCSKFCFFTVCKELILFSSWEVSGSPPVPSILKSSCDWMESTLLCHLKGKPL